jgi:hypothetical protein
VAPNKSNKETTMRPRLGIVSSEQLAAALAQHESRSQADMLHKLISDAANQKLGNSPTPTTALDHIVDHDRGRFLVLPVKPALRHMVREFAAREERSLANAMRYLLKAGLKAHNVPVPTSA